MAVPRIPIGSNRKENLQQMMERYKILSEPQTVFTGLTYFTLKQDWKLYKLLKMDPNHPVDTGLMKEKWIPPARIEQIQTFEGDWEDKVGIEAIRSTPYFSQYKASIQSGQFNVYVLNTATVGEQASRKSGLHTHRKKKLSGRHNLKRYMPFVDERTGFYTNKLRQIKQEMNIEWREFVPRYLTFVQERTELG